MGKRKITDDDEKLIMREYKTGKSALKIWEEFFKGKIKYHGTINDVLKRNGFTLHNAGYYRFGKTPPNKKMTRDDEKFIIEKYKEGISAERILKLFNGKFKTSKTIFDILRKYGIDIKSGNSDYTDPNLIHNYFDHIDTPIKAYLLGWMVGDGYVNRTRNQVAIQLAECDIHIVKLFKKEFNTENNISHINTKPIKNEKLNKTYVPQNAVRLAVTSKPMIEALDKHGIVQNKTNIEKLPILSDELMPHLLRGFFDADGSIFLNKKSGKINISFSKSGCILGQISLYLHISLNVRYQSIYRSNNSAILRKLAWGHQEDVAKIICYLYRNSKGMRLKRKYEKTCELVKLLKQNI